jgi:signal peptidase II
MKSVSVAGTVVIPCPALSNTLRYVHAALKILMGKVRTGVMPNWVKYVALSGVIVAADKSSKVWAEQALSSREVISITSWFDFSLVYNSGAAFGLLNNAGGWQTVFFAAIALLVSGVLVILIKQLEQQERLLGVAYACVLGGAIGNLIDRLMYGKVIDFVHWFYQNYHWPHFNIADIAICIGAAILIIDAFGLLPGVKASTEPSE